MEIWKWNTNSVLIANDSLKAYLDAAFSFHMTAAAKAVDVHKRGRRAELRGE